jgi:hypothetical protein
MAKHRVLLVGSTGETGGDILDGLIEDDSFVSANPLSIERAGRCASLSGRLSLTLSLQLYLIEYWY